MLAIETTTFGNEVEETTTPMTTPAYCPHCRDAGVIATVNGPTCTHHKHGTGVAWFPSWWDQVETGMGVAMQIRREKFLTELAKLPPPTVATIEFDFA
jgi:hypothetical protein